MTNELYTQCFIACLIGNVIHILIKASSLSKDFKAANMDFNIGRDLFKPDMWVILLDVVGSFAMVYVADELVDNEFIMGKIKIGFILIGISGSYLIFQLLSKAKRPFRETVDKSTNITNPK